ncbi:MAG: inositol monophosphatase [Sphaerochaetaceae bacterium]|nr:inositol monophosphatase [Sphaerochaetaceae bacterium]
MGNEELRQRQNAAQTAARRAGEFLLSSHSEESLNTTAKGRNDFVTAMDITSEEIIKEYLHERFPQDNFLGEEGGYQHHGDGGTWVIDPIDGTSNFIHGLPGFTVSIAYEKEQWKPVVGVIYDPSADDMYSAVQGEGAFCNDLPISVSPIADPHRTVVLSSPPLRDTRRLSDYLRIFKVLCTESGEIRGFGSAALHLCYVAAGRADAYIEFNLNYHDMAAGLVIVKEAGGNISDLDLNDIGEFPSHFIISNAFTHQWFCDTVQLPGEQDTCDE